MSENEQETKAGFKLLRASRWRRERIELSATTYHREVKKGRIRPVWIGDVPYISEEEEQRYLQTLAQEAEQRRIDDEQRRQRKAEQPEDASPKRRRGRPPKVRSSNLAAPSAAA